MLQHWPELGGFAAEPIRGRNSASCFGPENVPPRRNISSAAPAVSLRGSSELNGAKVAAARANLVEARLSDQVTILPGDAMTTLNDIHGPIDLVLLDGWKDLCLPVLRSLESRPSAGALIVADDINLPSMSSYLEYVRNPANGYVTVAFPVDDGMELSCWTNR